MRSGCLVLGLGLLLAGCGGSEEEVPLARTIQSGDYRLVLDDSAAVRLYRRGELLLRFEADGWQLGLLPEVTDELNYDPYRIYDPHPLYTVSDDLSWASVASARFIEAPEDALALELSYPGGLRAELHAESDATGRFALRLVPLTAEQVAYIRLRPRASASEAFYGLGEYFDQVNHRGKVRAMQIELIGSGPKLESQYNEAHVPVPLLLGTRGWGLFVPSRRPGSFAVATAAADLIEVAYGTGTASSEGLRLHLLAAEHPLDLTRHYYELSGWPKLPARWALGPWIWRDENDDQAQVESDLDIIRAEDLATTGYWIDRPYATAVNTFDFKPSQFPDPQAMIAKMHALGFRTALWHTPYLDEASSATAALRTEAEDKGYYPSESGISLNGWGKPIDLTNPDAVGWWREQLQAYKTLGVEGFKLDYGEDVIVGPTTKRIRWAFDDGSDERTQHSSFPIHYHKTYEALLPSDGGFLLCRASTFGDQAKGLIIWPGDLDANFATHGQERDDDEKPYVAVGGLPAAVVAAMSLGPSGFAFFGSDTGGYRHCPPDNETFSRWFEHTALSTVMQVGTSCNDVPWEATAENGFDQALLDRYRQYARLHLRLFPFLWSYAKRMLTDGRAIMRPLGLAHPELSAHPNDIYLLGDELLVAPVVSRGATTREVIFPEGTWVHWLTSERFDGPATHLVEAPIGRLPLFLKADAMVPLLRPNIDTLVATEQPDSVESYATSPGLLYVRAVAEQDSSFVLFDGGEIRQATSAGKSEIDYQAGDELSEGAMFELLGQRAPNTVEVDGKPVSTASDLASLEKAASGWYYDANEQRTWLKLPPPSSKATIGWE